MTTRFGREKLTGRRSGAGGPTAPPGAWHAVDAVWGAAQRVRLVTGPPTMANDDSQTRSIHIVGFLPPAEGSSQRRVLLVVNKDGSLTFPGGRLEPRETLDQALDREVWEEARARIAGDWRAVAATRIEYLNRVPGRIYRFHPMFLLWVAGDVVALSDEPHHDPADSVVGRRVVPLDEAHALLGPLEQVVLQAATGAK